MNKTKKCFFRQMAVMLVVLLGAGGMTGYAQSDFEYEDSDETVITGLTATGMSAYSLTIPKEVTTVKSKAFDYSSAKVSALIIEAGGNPAFESGLFGKRENPLGDIKILGSSMTVANISKLFASLGAKGDLGTVYIEGYSGYWSDIAVTDVLTDKVSVTLPAALVSDQQFGDAKVYGRFDIDKEIISFCTSATFFDEDDGSNQLFYVADGIANDGRLHIQRVRYIKAGEGVLIHRIGSSSGYADLLRYSGSISSAEETLYGKNMLVGVTTATTIGKTDGSKTNYVLKDGAFHPTSGGTIKANKAYLQIPTNAAREGALAIDFDDEDTGIVEMRNEKGEMRNGEMSNGSAWFTLDGRKLDTKSSAKGLYINNGKKYIIK